jgi:hypothetical protein
MMGQYFILYNPTIFKKIVWQSECLILFILFKLFASIDSINLKINFVYSLVQM